MSGPTGILVRVAKVQHCVAVVFCGPATRVPATVERGKFSPRGAGGRPKIDKIDKKDKIWEDEEPPRICPESGVGVRRLCPRLEGRVSRLKSGV